MSIFQTVLDRLRPSDEAEPEPSPVAAGIRGLTSGFVAGTSGDRDGATAARAYAEIAGDAPELPPPADPHPWLRRTTMEEVAADLGLSGGESPEDLAALRRRFASLNHPDLFAAERRADAGRRMTIANSLIDAALRRHAGRK
ncbi:hypothetical protein [Ensifer soli]|uniref:hypothetical protein n=1 Tax=Ciceribacter sp. sgz301302 TaxID=3342379 RepID=UPI0035B6EC22